MLRHIETKDELAQLLGHNDWEEVLRLLGGAHYKPISVLHKGKRKEGWAPNDNLKGLQSKIATLLNSEYEPPDCVHGYVAGRSRSVLSNARSHLGSRWVVNIDLEGFFASITHAKITEMLEGDRYYVRPDVAAAIADIACHDGSLTLGSPSSPVLSNIVFQELDERLAVFREMRGWRYTRYSDDMTFSTKDDPDPSNFVYRKNGYVMIAHGLREIIEEYDWRINDRKTRIAGVFERQTVTGLVVNERVNLPRRYITKLRSQLHQWRRLGLNAAAERFDEGRRHKNYRNVVLGRIQHIGAVRGFGDQLYLNLRNSFNELEALEVLRRKLE